MHFPYEMKRKGFTSERDVERERKIEREKERETANDRYRPFL